MTFLNPFSQAWNESLTVPEKGLAASLSSHLNKSLVLVKAPAKILVLDDLAR